MFRIELLPAQQGDALWIEYGDDARPFRILVDMGTPPTAGVVRDRIEALDPTDRSFELLIVTHIDTDHIGGVLRVIGDLPSGLAFGDVWFNAWRHLVGTRTDRMGPIDGEVLSTLLDHRGWPWNSAFGGDAAEVSTDGAMPSRLLPGGMRLTLLSPGPEQLIKLRSSWGDVVRDAGLDPDDPDRAAEVLASLAGQKGVRLDRLGEEGIDVQALAEATLIEDSAPANGSTIAVLAEFEGKAALLAGDAHARVLAKGIRRLLGDRDRAKLRVDAFKLPHHGSRHNVSADLLSLVSTRSYLFSTNGNIFGHPDREAVARVIRHGGGRPILSFNYRTDLNRVWDDPDLMADFGYEVAYPEEGAAGLVVDL